MTDGAINNASRVRSFVTTAIGLYATSRVWKRLEEVSLSSSQLQACVVHERINNDRS